MIVLHTEFMWLSILVGIWYAYEARTRGQRERSDVTYYITIVWSFVSIYVLLIAIQLYHPPVLNPILSPAPDAFYKAWFTFSFIPVWLLWLLMLIESIVHRVRTH